MWGNDREMEYLIVLLVFIVTMLVLKIGMNVKIEDIKEIGKLGEDNETNDILKAFPDNKKICEEILEKLDNKNVIIEETKDENSQTSLYLVMQNKILIANIKDSFTRIQTIAHECIHSVQNKKLLKFNFIFSNINILYFLIISILAIFKVTNKEVSSILLVVLTLMQFIFYVVRSFLETDAMTRAEYLAKEYIEETNILSKENAEFITDKYKTLNKIGIKLYNFILACQSLMKPIIYCLFIIIFCK